MANIKCPNCSGGDVASRTVKDRFRAEDPDGDIFEVGLQLLVWRCRACKLCWQGQEALAAKEAAYQHALRNRSARPLSPFPEVHRGSFAERVHEYRLNRSQAAEAGSLQGMGHER